MTAPPSPTVPPRRLASGWFLGFVFVALAVAMWLRGGGRFVLPLLLAGAVVMVVLRAVKAIRAPLP